MSEEFSSDKKRAEAKLEERVKIEPVDLPVNVQSSDSPPPIPSSSLVAGLSTHNGVNGVHGGEASNGRDDSEAETVVLSGKDRSRSEGRRKTVKQEITDGIEPQRMQRIQREAKMGRHEGSDKRQKSEDENGQRASLKRKRGRESGDVGIVPADWNTLSPALSSPAYEAQSPRSSDSVFNRPRSPPGDEATPKKGRPRRKPRQDQDGDDQERQQRGKSDPSSEKPAVKERRETRSSITQHEVPAHRSESPPVRTHKRAQSIQSNISESHGVKRRKIPQPLIIDQRRKPSEDAHGDSDDTSSVYSRPSLQKLTSTDANPLVKVSKKNRDKNGRTLLARACALDEVEAEMRLKERPEDLDIPDNAGNTPLQIASLEGKAKIVQLLLEAGCDINCKNIDMDTPLIDAVENGHVDVVRLLLKAGLDPRQSNAKGEEPLDLVNSENDHYDAIRAALITAKERVNPSRFSEERTFHRQRDHRFSNIASGASPTDPLPLHTPLHPLHTSLHPAISPLHNSLDSAKSPPPGARRRTARSQPTRDGLLWVTATPENLRDAAGKGDLTVVDHILKMRPIAGNESVLAASRGGHELVVELLIAIGKPDPDPDPIRSSDYMAAYSTPMLAAIGRGNVEVLKLLLNQPGFDPTRRLYRNLAYHELAKERKSTVWQEEYRILKEAYDNHIKHRAKRANHISPQRTKAKTSELTSHKSNSDTSSPISGKSKNSHTSPWEPKEDGRRDSKSSPSTGWESREDSKRDPKNSHSIGWEHKEEIRRESKYAQSGAWEPKGKEEYKRDIRGSHSTMKEDAKRDSAQLPPSQPRADQENRDRASDTLTNRHKPKGMRSASDAGQPEIHKKRKLFTRNALKDTARDTTRDTTKDTTKGSSKDPTKDSTRDTMNTVKRRASLAEATAYKKRRVGAEPLTLDPPQLQHRPAKIANMISPDSTASPTVASGAPVAFMGSGSSPVLQSPIRQSPAHQPPIPKSGLDKKDNKNTSRSGERVQPVKDTRKRDLSPKEARKCDLSPREFRKREQSPKGLKKLDLSPKEARKRHRADTEADDNRRIAREEEESRRQAQELEKKKKDEESQRKRVEYERIRKEEAERLRDQEREKLLKEEQERIRKGEELERIRKGEELERTRKREELERTRKREELERIRKGEELERIRKVEELERIRKREELERIRKVEELERIRKLEELERIRKREELERIRKREELERIRKEEELERVRKEKERLRKEEERLLMEEEEKSRKQEEERRLKEEAEKALREEEERRQKEEQERLRKEEEEERIRREKEDKLRKEEEDRRLKEKEEQRLKQEKEEKRLKAELEERERQRVLAEEQERKRREALPNGLRRAAELSPEQAKERKEIVKWLPLHTVTTYDLDPDCENRVAEERWIGNVQVAPILAITDLNLSQCANLSSLSLPSFPYCYLPSIYT